MWGGSHLKLHAKLSFWWPLKVEDVRHSWQLDANVDPLSVCWLCLEIQPASTRCSHSETGSLMNLQMLEIITDFLKNVIISQVSLFTLLQTKLPVGTACCCGRFISKGDWMFVNHVFIFTSLISLLWNPQVSVISYRFLIVFKESSCISSLSMVRFHVLAWAWTIVIFYILNKELQTADSGWSLSSRGWAGA
jgi:hypothetical protein